MTMKGQLLLMIVIMKARKVLVAILLMMVFFDDAAEVPMNMAATTLTNGINEVRKRRRYILERHPTSQYYEAVFAVV